MNDEKITISMDEVERATPVPGTPPPPIISPGYTSPESESAGKPKRTGLRVGIGIAVVAVLCLAGIGIAAGVMARNGDKSSNQDRTSVRTVDDIRRELIADTQRELDNPFSPLRKRIEDAHLTVDVTSAEVKRCDISTLDGSNRAGNDDSNVSIVQLLLRFYWTGILDSGYTDLKIVHDAVNDRTESAIDYTTATLNLEDPNFWFGVGALIGECLFDE